MKKIVSDVRVRIAAYIAGILATIILAGSIGGMVLMYGFGSKEDALEQGYQSIAANYMMYALDKYWDSPEEVIETLENTNLYYKICDYISMSGTDSYQNANVIYSNVPDGYEMKNAYQVTGERSVYYRYNINSMMGALSGAYCYGSGSHYLYTKVLNLTYNPNDSMFYIRTNAGYFLVEYLMIREAGLYYNYLIEEIDGKTCYYDANAGKIFDITTITTWSEICLGYNTETEQHIVYTEDDIFEFVDILEDGAVIDENRIDREYYTDGEFLYYSNKNAQVYTVVSDVAPELTKDDLFMEWNQAISSLYAFEHVAIYMAVLAGVLLIICIAVLIYGATDEREKLKLRHKIPLCIYLVVIVLVEIGIFALEVGVSDFYHANMPNVSIEVAIFVVATLIAAMITPILNMLSNVAVRIKTKTLYRYSELYYLCKPFVLMAGYARENVSLFWKVTIGTLVIDVFEIGFIWLWFEQFSYIYYNRFIYVVLVIYKFIQLLLIVCIAMQMHRLKKGSERIASGDFTESIDTKKMFWEFKKHGENINKMREGIKVAVESQLKSERLKTELITNVSHDIKTPLTSIINYVDLIKKEELTDPTLCEYVDVLDRQSARLKKLIEDLMEASKASTGNVKVETEECDITVLLTQVVGEFEERLAVNNLETVILKPEEKVLVLADGRHMWRVLDNLMNNICKYSLPNSRVYVQVTSVADDVQIQFKNISKSQLNISSDELMERFVRGDSSRNTEGSGLGLSIAQSLVELMQGSMKLEIDGDLFKVTLRFPIYHKPEAIEEITN